MAKKVRPTTIEILHAVLRNMPVRRFMLAPILSEHYPECLDNEDNETLDLINDLYMDSIEISETLFDACDELGADIGHAPSIKHLKTVGDLVNLIEEVFDNMEAEENKHHENN